MSKNDTQMTFEELLARDGYLVYTNVGTSMLPLLRQGRDLLEIRRKDAARCRKYDAVLYKTGGRYILHRILQVRERDYVIVGDHCFRKEYGITDGQILGVLTGIVRGGKHISTSDRLYRCYVHLWCDFYPVRAGLLYCGELFRRAKAKLRRLIGAPKNSRS